MTGFLLAHFWAILGSVLAIAGTGGLLFAIFGLGLSMPVIFSAVLGIVKGLIEFMKTPAGQVVGILLLCALFLLIGITRTAKIYEAKIAALKVQHQHDLDQLNAAWRAKVDKAAALFAEKRKERDAAVDKTVADAVAQSTADLAAKAQKLQAEVNTYAKLSHPKDCVLGPADLDGGMRAHVR